MTIISHHYRPLHRLSRPLVVLAVAVFLLALSAPAASAADAEVKLSLKTIGNEHNGYMLVSAKPGETLQLTVQLGNYGTTATLAKVFAADAYTIANGGFGARLDGEAQTGTTTWITYPTETLTLEAGEAQTRSFPLTIPADTRPGDYLTSLIIQNADAIPGSGGMAINRIVRQALPISIDVTGPRTPALAIGGARQQTSGANSAIIFDVSNTGNQNLKPAGEYVLTDSSGAEVDRRQVTMGSVYAGNVTTLELNYAQLLAPGDYTASLTLTDAPTGATAQLQAAPINVPVVAAPLTATQAANNNTPGVIAAQGTATPDAAGTPIAAGTLTTTPKSGGGLGLPLVLGIALACLLGGVATSFGVVRLRAGRKPARVAPSAPRTPSTPPRATALNGTPVNMASKGLLSPDKPSGAVVKRLL